MANAYTAGAVTAKITIDTKNFKHNVDDLIARVEVLKSHLKEVGTFNDISKKVKELESELSTTKTTFSDLSKKVEDYKKQLKTLRDENKSLQQSLKDAQTALKNRNQTLDESIKKNEKLINSNKNLDKSLDNNGNTINKATKAVQALSREETKATTAAKKFRKYSNNWQITNKQLSDATKAFKASPYSKMGEDARKASTSLQKFHTQQIKNINSEIAANEKLEASLNRGSAKYIQAKKDFLDLIWQRRSHVDDIYPNQNLIEPISRKDINKFLPAFSSSNNRKQAVKQTQYEMEKILKSIGASVSKEVFEDYLGRKSKRTRWVTGEKASLIGSIDVSKMDDISNIIRRTLALEDQLGQSTKKVKESFSEEIDYKVWEKADRAVESLMTREEKLERQTRKTAEAFSKIKYDDYIKINRLSEREWQGLAGINRANQKLDTQYWKHGTNPFFSSGNRMHIVDKEKWAEEVMAWAKSVPRLDLNDFFEKYWKLESPQMHHKVTTNRFSKDLTDKYGHDMGFKDWQRTNKLAWLEYDENTEIETLKRVQQELKETEIEYTRYGRIKRDALGWLKEGNEGHFKNLLYEFSGFGKSDQRIGFNRTAEEIENAIRKFAQIDLKSENIRNYLKAWSEAPVTVNRSANEIENAIRKFAAVDYKSQRTLLKEYLHEWSEAPIVVKRSTQEIENAISKFAGFKTTGLTTATRDWLKGWSDAEIVVKRSVDEISAALSKLTTHEKYIPKGADYLLKDIETATNAYSTLQRRLKSTEIDVEGFSKIYDSLGATFYTNNVNINAAKNVLKLYDDGLEKSKQRLREYEIQTKQTFETMQVELAKANAAQYKYWKQVRGTADVKGYNQLGTLDTGINQYYGQIDKINSKLAEFKRQQQSVNDSVNQSYNTFAKASEGLALLNKELDKYGADVSKYTQKNAQMTRQVQQLKTQIGAFSKTDIGSKAFAGTNSQLNILGNRLNVLKERFRTGKITQDQYRQGIDALGKELSALHTKIQTTTRDLQQGNLVFDKNGKLVTKTSENYKKMGAGMTQTAHSGRILSNTLYQIRGALLSLKMIFTAMGGMALWGFGMEMVESVKTTMTARNEMMAQLNQNSKIDASGIEYFTNSLDDLTKEFKKVNKYSIGETASSIGLEFDLNAEQMKKALPIITMISSEYVRAGRKEEEAALAVKDILQGEFQRLSRETGVGKDELVAFGWDEDKENIDGLLKALNKAALSRHWDTFAKKATSLNDVLTITKSRFSETGADILDSATPMIVEGFNLIIRAIDDVQKGFNGLNAFWQNFITVGGGVGLLAGIGAAIPMVTKGMGLADIATIGWTKSLATAALNLNKATVAQYGFKKALAEVITGTKVSEMGNIRWSKSIMGRILGLKQSTLAEKGYMTSLVQSNLMLKGKKEAQALAMASTMNFKEKLVYLTTSMKANEVQGISSSKAIFKMATSWKILRTILLGVIGIGVAAWLSSIAVQADLVKKRVSKFNEVAASGKSKIKEMTKLSETYQKTMDKYENSDNEKDKNKYGIAKNNKAIVDANKKELELSYNAVKAYKKQNKEREKSITLAQSQFRQNALLQAGHTADEATEKSLGYYDSVKQAQYEITKSYNEQYKWLEASSKHISQNVGLMMAEKREQKDIDKYINEYATVAEEAGEHLKKFYQGDMYSGLYYLVDLLKLQWIDLWNNKVFVDFWETVKKTWEDLKPLAYGLKDALQGIAETILKFLSTDNGRWVGVLAAAGVTIGGLVYKFRGFLGTLKKVGSSIWGRIKDFKKLKKTAKDTSDVLGGDSSTGGITGDTDTGKKLPKNRGEWWADTKGQIYQDATKYARAAVAIAAGMALISEAILLLNAPMMSLAATGWTFKQLEPEIRKGIDGLKLIAPVMAVFLPPVVALMVIMDKYGKAINMETLADSFLKSAMGIAMAVTLVTEAIFLLNMPLIALGSLGAVYGSIQTNAQQGIIAMRTVNDALYALVPWIPVFIAGIALAAAASTGVGAIGLVEVAMGIAIGIGLVTEAIFLLNEPLIAIATVGQTYQSLDGVKEGAEALKLTAEALTYVGEAMAALALVDISLLTQHISDIISQWTGVDLGGSLTDLTAEGGVISQLNQFAQEFNKFEFVEIDQAKVQTLAAAGDGVSTVGTAMQKVKAAMDNLPAEFKNNNAGERLGITGNNTNGTTAETPVQESQGYFDAFKEPIKQLKDFVYEFNHNEEFNIEPVNSDRITSINSAADMITQVNTAVEKVKTAMQNVGSAGHETAFATGGAFMALGYDLFHMTGLEAINNGTSSGGYKSSLGSSLQAMEDVISDMFTFQSRISQYGGEGGETPEVGGVASIVTRVQEAISSLSQSLSDAVPTMEGHGKSIGSAIVNGVKSGLDGLGSDISSKVATAIDAAKPTAATYGKGLGWNVQNGFKNELKISETLTTEVNNALTAIGDGKAQEFYDKGKALGDAFARGFKDGSGIHSPGYAAQAMQSEIGYIGQYLNNGIVNLPSLASQLGNALSSNFNLDFNLSNIQLPDMTTWASKLGAAIPIVNDVKTQVSSKFEGMKTNVQGSFNSILSKTRSTMTNMKSATIGHIGNIKSSWHGMQTSLIASADYIKTQTSTKIDKLKTNLGDFWNKVKHPDQLIGGAAGSINSKGTIRRRSRPHFSVPKGNYAGSFNFKPQRSKGSPTDMKDEYLKCLLAGQECYAGGWNFNWTNKISKKFKGWKTHFGQFHLDDYLNVGKFQNSNFPVRGNAEVAKAYIYDVISATKYGSYFNSHFGDDPVAALRAGVFNCWDGANIILAIARAFGFSGGMGHGSWDGIGHVWASIPGLGNIDATAIQNGYGFTSPKVTGYAGTIKRGSASSKVPDGAKTTNNHNEVHIHIHGDVYGVDDLDSRIDDGANRVARQLFRDSYSGV